MNYKELGEIINNIKPLNEYEKYMLNIIKTNYKDIEWFKTKEAKLSLLNDVIFRLKDTFNIEIKMNLGDINE